MSAITTDVKSIQEVVKERLEGQVAALIPEEAWSAMVDKAVSSLCEPPPKRYNSDPQLDAPIVQMMKQAIKEIADQRIKEELASEKWLVKFDGYQKTFIDDHIRKMIREQGPLLMTSYFAGMAEFISVGCVQSLRNELNSHGGNF